MTDLFRFAPWFGMALLLATLVLLEAGRRIGAARIAADPDGAAAGVSAVEAAVFALLGLLIAFTFSGAAQRFDARRQLIIEEANAIRTAWLRLDVLSRDEQPPMRQLLREYIDSRVETYQKLPDAAASAAAHARSEQLLPATLAARRRDQQLLRFSLGHGTVTARAHRPIRSQVDPRNGCAHPSAGNRLRDARRADPDGGSSATTWRVARRAIGCTSSASRS